MLEHSLTGLLSCFYPADNIRDNKALAYYRQREWRIAWNFAIRDEEVMRRPSSEMIDRLINIDAGFFARDFPTMSGTKRLAEEAFVFPGIGDKKIIQMVKRLIVPRAAMSSVKSILDVRSWHPNRLHRGYVGGLFDDPVSGTITMSSNVATTLWSNAARRFNRDNLARWCFGSPFLAGWRFIGH